MGHAFGYAALVVELLAYAGQMVLLPKVSKRYGSLTLTSLYYTVASLTTAATLILREHGNLSQVIYYTFHLVLYKLPHTVAPPTFGLYQTSTFGNTLRSSETPGAFIERAIEPELLCPAPAPALHFLHQAQHQTSFRCLAADAHSMLMLRKARFDAWSGIPRICCSRGCKVLKQWL